MDVGQNSTPYVIKDSPPESVAMKAIETVLASSKLKPKILSVKLAMLTASLTIPTSDLGSSVPELAVTITTRKSTTLWFEPSGAGR